MVYFILAIQCLYPKPNPKRFSKGDFLYHPTGILFTNNHKDIYKMKTSSK